MKCEICNSEWTPLKNIKSMFCPFCRSPLIEVGEKFNDLGAVFFYMTSEFGTEILKNKQNVLQFLEAFFSQGKREYNFVNNIYTSGLVETLFRLQNVPEAIQKSAVKQVEIQFSEKYGISKDWAEYIIGCLSKALGLYNNIGTSVVGLKQMAERGDSSAQVELAKRYHLGQGVPKDQQQYILWLQKAAGKGVDEALFLLGQELLLGNVCEKNIKEAAVYLETTALNDNADSICLIASNADLQRLCDIGLEEKLTILLKRRDTLSPKQLIQISRYYEGKDDDYSLTLARLSYEKDAKYSWESYVKLLKRTKTHETEALALKVTKEMANEGNVFACTLLAKRYEDNTKTEKDMLSSLYWYRLAAESGNLDAQMRLAEIYETGKVIDKDIDTAVYWYKIAAFNGSQIAKRKISYKCDECITSTITLVLNDDTELECLVRKAVIFQGNDYLIIEDPDSRELFPIQYIENDTIEGFEIQGVDENIKKIILCKFGGFGR